MRELPEELIGMKNAVDIMNFAGSKFKDSKLWGRFVMAKMMMAIDNAMDTYQKSSDEVEVEQAKRFLLHFVRDANCANCGPKDWL